MSEYWVSKKKYYCKYCEIYIADDAPSRQQHENGLRHKGNLERFIRGIYKAGEKKKKDDEEERREMARVEQAAQIAFAQDVGAGHAKLSSSTPPPAASSSRKPPPKPSNPWANYSTAKSLGYEDPDAGQLVEPHRTQGLAGEWEVVAPEAAEAEPVPSVSEVGTKRPADDMLAAEESREFKFRKRTMATGLGQIYDPGSLSIKLKKKEGSPEPTAPLSESSSDAAVTADKPKWVKLQWKRAGDPEEANETLQESIVKTEADDAELVAPKKAETGATPQLDEPPPPEIKTEPTPSLLSEIVPDPPVIFKKRKIPAGGSRGRR